MGDKTVSRERFDVQMWPGQKPSERICQQVYEAYVQSGLTVTRFQIRLVARVMGTERKPWWKRVLHVAAPMGAGLGAGWLIALAVRAIRGL